MDETNNGDEIPDTKSEIRDLIDYCGLCDKHAVEMLSSFLGDDLALEVLCQEIDDLGLIDDFSEFAEDYSCEEFDDTNRAFDNAEFQRRIENGDDGLDDD